MAKLSSADDLIEYAYRKLGKPVINIEVDDTQAQDRVEDALQLYIQRHFDGVQEEWIKYTLTATDISRGYKIMNNDIVEVVELIPMNSTTSEAWTGIIYQFRLHHLENFTSPDMTNYIITMQHINLVKQLLTPVRTFTFNHLTHKLTLLGDMSEGNFFVAKVYKALDTDFYTDIFNDEWMKKYTTALIKKQWGSNLKKFGNVQMPGGVELNAQEIFEEGREEVQELEQEFSEKYELPVDFFFG